MRSARSGNVEVVILNQDDGETFEEDLVRDVKEILAVFNARLYGNRSPRIGRLLEALHEALHEVVDTAAPGVPAGSLPSLE